MDRLWYKIQYKDNMEVHNDGISYDKWVRRTFCNWSRKIDGGISGNDVGLYLAGAGGASLGAYAVGTYGAKLGGSIGAVCGGPGGAIIGGILCGTAGLFIYTVDASFTGEASFNGIWKSYTAGALTGAGIGVWFTV